jgi:hypothetical protein
MSPAIPGWLEILFICWSAFIWPSRRLIRFAGTSPRFRYHHEVTREFKVQRWADKLNPQSRHLLEFLADLTDAGRITTTRRTGFERTSIGSEAGRT